MGAFILYPNHMKNRAPNLPAKSFKTNFSAWQPICLTSESNFFNKILQFPLGFAQNGSWSVPNKKKTSFYLIFHAFSRPKFPPVWPGPIPGPYQPFPGIMPPYRPPIPPTSPPPTWPSKISSKFPPGIASPYTKHKSGNLGIILPYRKFSTQLQHPHWTGAPRVSTFNTLPLL